MLCIPATRRKAMDVTKVTVRYYRHLRIASQTGISVIQISPMQSSVRPRRSCKYLLGLMPDTSLKYSSMTLSSNILHAIKEMPIQTSHII